MAKLLHDGPKSSPYRLLLAHGAGAGMDTPFMRGVANALAARAIRVTRFEFPYMQRRVGGARSAPDRMPVLLESYRAVVAQLGEASELFIGGKSMGGRVASMIADELGVAGLVCLGYPFHPPDKPDKTRTDHLRALKTRCLIVQGTRDPFGTQEDVAGYVLSKRICVRWIEDGDHSWLTRRKLGHDPTVAFAEACEAIGMFVIDRRKRR
ncbi:MAG TPA: alpha/beta family hydrolase [Polyangiales bacterium]